jgi:mannose-6-phosphate isomerase-like protein (cupin superfamily)
MEAIPQLQALPQIKPKRKLIWTADEIIEEAQTHGGGRLQVFFNAGLSVSILTVQRGGRDGQKMARCQSHDADELYMILRGEGKLRIRREDHNVAAGRLIVVPASVPHFFHSVVTEELIALAVLGGTKAAKS